jgi:outer membrane protein assembly factor BamB
MNRRKFSAAVLRFALACAYAHCLAHPASAQEAQPAPNPSEVFQLAKPVGGKTHPDPAAFEFEMGGFNYHVRQNGNGWRKKGEKTRRFNLRLDDGGLERVYFHDYGGRLLLVCEVGDGGYGSGFVTLLEQPSMRGLWRQHIPGFNVGEPLREGRSLYVTGIGFVGKLDLGTGEFDWKQEDLYDTREGVPKHFNSFEKPELAGDTVLFRERAVYNQHKTLVVDKKTGKTIRVE